MQREQRTREIRKAADRIVALYIDFTSDAVEDAFRIWKAFSNEVSVDGLYERVVELQNDMADIKKLLEQLVAKGT